ncbi:MAG: hypothetical protein KME16_00370 [Scytolyngbya sp. HA4215-MV1]|nr:hypothetical protein [Scytolyngbya sp. HA4215-MV1]
MPVTIGTVNSTLNVTDGGSSLTPSVLEQVVQHALARLKDQQENDKKMQEEQEISDRATPSG